MLGIAQSVLIFVFANFSITFIGQIRTLHFVWSNGYLKYFFFIICTALWHVQLFNNEIFWVFGLVYECGSLKVEEERCGSMRWIVNFTWCNK